MKEFSKEFLKNKKVIIFDFDGTLADTVGIWNEVDFKAIKEMSGKEVNLDTIQKERDRVLLENKDKSVYEEDIDCGRCRAGFCRLPA